MLDLNLIDITLNKAEMFSYLQDPFCQMVFKSFETYYPKVGFEKPWIGYFFTDAGTVVATGGFKGTPKNGQVEIAYGTLPSMEGRGYGTKVCEMLVNLAFDEMANIVVTARTLKVENASTKILRKNGFKFVGVVLDPDDGEVWEWHLLKKLDFN